MAQAANPAPPTPSQSAVDAAPQGSLLPTPAEPIIPNSQFEEALPPVDPELNAPLADIDDVLPPPAPDAPAESAPALAGPVPADPALSEPLPALSSFEVTPEADLPGMEETEQAATVRYDVVVTGLDEVGLEGTFSGLSALDDGDGEAANGAVLTARAREDEQLALRILRSEGYYDGVVTSSVEVLPDTPGRVRATVAAVPGGRYSLGTITLDGPETVPPGLVRDAFRLNSGDPLVAADIEGAEAAISLKLPQQGYPFVELGARDVVLDATTLTGDYTLPVDPGPRSSFGTYSTTGDLAFDAEHVGVLARFEEGQIYNSLLVDDLRQALIATGLLATASVEPVRTGRMGPEGTEVVDLLVRQDAGPARRLTAGAGYGTGEGFRLEGTWTHRNLFPPEGALGVQAVGGTQQQLLGVNFTRSNAGLRDRTVFLGASVSQNDYEAFQAYTAQISGRISRISTPIWQKRWTYAYGFEVIATNETVFRNINADGDDQRETYFVAALPGEVTYDRSNSLLDPTRGFKITARLSPEISQRDGGPNSQYLRGLLEGSVYYPATDALTVAGRVRVGSIPGVAREDLAPSRRYYAGGGGSVRGFGFQQLGPRDANNDPIGGRSLNEFALEGRYRFGDYGVVAFIDGGQVYDSVTPGFNDLRFGVGIGGRLYTNFGPLRVDIATPLGRREGEPTVALYISIGQAF